MDLIVALIAIILIFKLWVGLKSLLDPSSKTGGEKPKGRHWRNNKRNGRRTSYKVHCWNCSSPISSEDGDRCKECGLFKCEFCGKCMCKDSPRPNHELNKRCADCGKVIDSKYFKCYSCSQKAKSFNDCEICGTEIEPKYKRCYRCNQSKLLR